MELTWTHPEAAHRLWPLAAAALAAALLTARALRADRQRYTSASLTRLLAPRPGARQTVLRMSLLAGALTLLVAAAADPRWGTEQVTIRQPHVDIALLVDVSRSMLAEDTPPSRIEQARLLVSDIAGRSRGERFALFSFAGATILHVPLTLAETDLQRSVDELVIRAGGSDLANALYYTANSFPDRDSTRIIVILTDGDNMSDVAIERAAILAREAGIRLAVIGLGTERGANIPDPLPSALIGRRSEARGGRALLPTESNRPPDAPAPRRWVEYDGTRVVTQLDTPFLERLAKAGNGFFINAGQSPMNVDAFMERLRGLVLDADSTERTIEVLQARYQWLVAPAFLLLLLEALLRTRPLRRTSNPGSPT